MSEEKNQNQGDTDKPGKKKKKSGQDEFPLQEYRLVPEEEWDEEGNRETEIDLIELAKYIWDNRSTIYKFVAVGVVIGLAVALLSPKEYVSDSTLMPEYSSESQGGGASSLLQQYGGLIGLSGGSYNSASNAIRVNLYPQIVSSLSFQKKIADQEFYFPDYDTTVSLMDYYLEVQSPGVFGYLRMFTIGLPGTIISAVFSNDEEASSSQKDAESGIISLTKDEMVVINNLRERISASLDEESGIITVQAKMPNPKVAANVAKFTIEELTEYLTDYRTEKTLRDLEFIEEQLGTARTRFREAQLALAEFDDSNKGNLTARASTERQRLQSEYDIAFNLYNSLSQQYEESKLKVQEETPVFKVLQPVQVPVDDETSGAQLVILFTILGIFLAGTFLIFRFVVYNYKSI